MFWDLRSVKISIMKTSSVIYICSRIVEPCYSMSRLRSMTCVTISLFKPSILPSPRQQQLTILILRCHQQTSKQPWFSKRILLKLSKLLVAFVTRSVTLIKPKPVKLSSFFDQVRPRSRAVIPTTTATPSGTTTTIPEATTTATTATTTTNPGQTTIPFATASNKRFVVNRRGSSQPVLFSMDHSFHRRLASQNNSSRIPNSVHLSTSTPRTASTNHSVQSTTRPIIGSRSFTFTQQRCNRRDSTYHTRILQQHVCDSKEKRWLPPRIQLEKAQQLHSSPTLQNGNTAGSYQTNQTEQLSNLNRSVRRLPSYSRSCRFPTLSSVELERQNLPILHNPIWPVFSSLVVHQTHQTNFGMGTVSTDSIECLSRRLDHHLRLSNSGNSTYPISSPETRVVGMDHQLQQIDSETSTINGTPRLLIGYYNNDSTTAREETKGFTSKYSTNFEKSFTVTPHHPQSHHENSSGNVCTNTSSIIHPTFVADEKSNGTIIRRLGQTSTTNRRMHSGAYLVEEQHHSLEWQEHITTDTSTNNLCRRQQQWMGMQLTTEQQQTPNRIWTLDSPRSTNVDQLERTQSSISRFEDLSKTTEHAHSYPNGQYNVHGIYEQAGWNPVPSPDGIGNSVMEMVSSTRNNHSIQPYLWDRQHHRRLRVSPPISEEQLDDRSCNLHSSPTPSGSKRRRSICRQDNETTSKIRVLAPQSRKLIYRRLYNPLESISTSILEPAMELDQSMPSEDYSGETSASHYDNTLVAQRALVPDNSVPEHQFTFTAPPVGYCPPITNLDLANDKQYLETRRLELIRSKYQQSDLNENAQAIFINRRIQDSSTNKSYKPGQLLFLKWCIEKQISQQFFTPADLINFLSDMYTNHSYAISTIQLFRAAVTNLHYNPSSIREDERLNSFITTLLGHAPPTRLHRPTVSLQPTVDHLMTLDNKTITLATLQSKLAFLLGVTCFLRPSDLHRIPLSSVSVSADSNLSFEVHCPKEKRQRRRIIKSFQVKAHIDPRLCPVHTFQLFHHRRPTCQATTLFINSLQPNKLISARTIQSWISKLIHRSTHEKRVSLRSIASSLALQSGIPKEDIITMGNWASSTTFENHYRREHLSTFDFTNTLIISDDTYGDDSQDEDIFYDADDNMDSI
jgi:hypothetical protein